MKKIILAFFIAVLVPLQACAQEQWKEGEHYTVINDTATDKPVINEFFSYWCPHCYNFEPLVAKIKSKISDDVKFEKVHVNFMGFTSPEIQDDASRALMVARALKKEDTLSNAIFRYIHVQKSPVTSIKDLKNIFLVNGVEDAEFDKLVSSFGVNSMLNKNNKLIVKYRKHLSGVPNFIVNGKYQAKFTRDMTNDDIVDLIVWLSKQK
ncbi:thiol:disulfide interchange protein DsbA/DsbL [Paraglaciecola polaris]|uniref:Thiol:disulfide interchange protein n=1 Tax=Paraglaciecola polaris LMG 21857 TaxID=1129793 RepID=K7AF14_9ALTE|nr:thiol:disulfide interchange protein DsbA/DsbL [Paraglaciecola polaris]GAC33885.1 thiol:disulfide interchange protein DsbA [Paraglaciecola polaris LMG 21857]|tara:strand:+ start:16526 stop:17149 length:624 start_codon:yes stop_codon:yes gene_type:complete